MKPTRLFPNVLAAFLCIVAGCQPEKPAQNPGAAEGVRDPGVRGGPPAAGDPLPGLTDDERAFFDDGLARFLETDAVPDGLGPRFNANQCAVCHIQPATGGSSPARNPLLAIATLDSAKNQVPWFIAPDGPIREARFKTNPDGSTDGGVHAIFVITGRTDAGGCTLSQPAFAPAGDPQSGQGGNPNVIFRIPTPVFGAGLIEAIPDAEILANIRAHDAEKKAFGVSGHPNAHISGTANVNANDGTITRFGWKAQNKSLLLFAAEAYNVEMGVTNPLFPQERDESGGCVLNTTPEDNNHFADSPGAATLSDMEAFAIFMRLLAPPAPAPETPETARGKVLFSSAGCASCHTPSFVTGPRISSGGSRKPSAALSGVTANLYSDLLVHSMGKGLADGITQGAAGPEEFRTAPLWGVGQRVFFLHDGRTTDIVAAIEAHWGKGSEANQVIEKFNRMSGPEQQAIVDFLRSL